VTDGTFTTCPDGTKEWSDVSVTAFPDSNSFLYAQPANLNPQLSSPNNTLTLMYDECRRTVPLGRNEYVLVNFKTVEGATGTEQLNIYTIHLFTDGTIIFFENGLQMSGRTNVVEGMQGAVGFGTSPNCPFSHVTAEFQIELPAAGGHSYSPDPLFWSSVTPSPPPSPPPPPPSGAQILQASTVAPGGAPITPVEMGTQYRLDVKVIENDTSSLSSVFMSGTVAEKLDPKTVQFGDFSPFNSNSSYNGTVPTGSAQDFLQPMILTPNDVYQHS